MCARRVRRFRDRGSQPAPEYVGVGTQVPAGALYGNARAIGLVNTDGDLTAIAGQVQTHSVVVAKRGETSAAGVADADIVVPEGLTTDATEYLQAAIDAVSADGGLVLLLEGTYRCEDGLTLADNISVEGVGGYASKVQRGKEDTTTFLFDASGTNGVILRRLSIQDDTSFDHGPLVGGDATNLTIEDCHLTCSYAPAILAEYGPYGWVVERCDITGSGAGSESLRVDSDRSSGFATSFLRDCRVGNDVHIGCQDWVVTGCAFETAACYIDACTTVAGNNDNVVVRDNIFFGGDASGNTVVVSASVDDYHVFGNSFIGCTTVEGGTDDLLIPVHALRIGASAAPTFTLRDTYFEVLRFAAAGGEYARASLQLPHAWREGTDLRPHVHFRLDTSGNNGDTVSFRVYYQWANVDADLPAGAYVDTTYTLDGTETTETVLMTVPATLSGSGKEKSSILNLRVERLAADTFAGNADVMSLDCHFERYRWGS